MIADLRRWAPEVLAVRAVLVLAGAGALWVSAGGEFVVSGMIAVFGLIGLGAAAVRPDSVGAAMVLVTGVLAWLVRYGQQPPSATATLLLGFLLAVHHQASALAAALPPTADVEPAVLVRFGLHAAVVLALSGAVAVLALTAGRPGGSVPLELAALVAVAVVVAVPVLLSRRL